MFVILILLLPQLTYSIQLETFNIAWGVSKYWNKSTPIDQYNEQSKLIINSKSDVICLQEAYEMFNSNHPTNPNMNFEGTFFKGTPEADGRRMTARPDDTTVIDWGIQANDEPMREVLKGLYMLSSILVGLTCMSRRFRKLVD